MSKLKANVIANFSSSLFVGLMGLVFIPLYTHFLGIESFGLIGFFATLLSIFSSLDLGLGATINREMSRLGAQKDKVKEMRDTVRTLEIPYWIVALLIGAAVVVLSPVLAYHWFKPVNLSPLTIQSAIFYMGIAIAFQWPFGLYSGGLVGRQQQVLLGVLNAAMAALRGVGAVLIIWLVSPTIEAYFQWQIFISALQTGLAAFFLWSGLPAQGHKPQFRKKRLLDIWRFATGVTGITLLSNILSQMDKIVLSRMLTMDTFGFYNVASTVASILFKFVGPVFQAVFPPLTQAYELKKEGELANLYHKGSQLVSVLILPTALVIAFFSKDIVLLWFRNPLTAENTHLLVSILVIGMVLNGLMNLPYALQLAAGWTRLSFMANLHSVLVMVPATILLIRFYGAPGAAASFGILNFGYIVLLIPIMHRRLLKKEMGAWYIQDILWPLLGALAIVVCAFYAVPLGHFGSIWKFLVLGAIWALATLTAISLAPFIRNICLRFALKLKGNLSGRP